MSKMVGCRPVEKSNQTLDFANIATDGVVTIIEIVDSTAYDVKFIINDDNQCLNVYVNEEFIVAKAYENLINLTEDDVTKTLKDKDAVTDAIRTYQMRGIQISLFYTAIVGVEALHSNQNC